LNDACDRSQQNVSENVNTAIAMRINRKFTEMVPVIPGRRTFRVEESQANRQYTRYASECLLAPSDAKQPATNATPDAMVKPI